MAQAMDIHCRLLAALVSGDTAEQARLMGVEEPKTLTDKVALAETVRKFVYGERTDTTTATGPRLPRRLLRA